MGKETKEVIFKPQAIKSIQAISQYIAYKGYRETAENFAGRLYSFAESLAIFPEKYPVCRFVKLAKRMMRCAIFEQNYVFIYKRVEHSLTIFNVIHCRALK